MTTTKPIAIVHSGDAASRDAHGQIAQDLFRRQEGGYQSSFNYMTLFTLPAGSTSGSHAHTNWEKIYFVISGECEAILGGQRFPVKAGDTFFVPFDVEHEMQNLTREPAQYVVFVNYTLPMPTER
ncbi:MAG: cupin domain-containing protein [Chloroflexi bacterium]|nr:cupin domain-containing protein [Chloroflexota bacterium]